MERQLTGDEVQISEHPWEGVAAYVVDAHGPSVRVVLKLFGRDVPAEFSKFSVMPTGKAKGTRNT